MKVLLCTPYLQDPKIVSGGINIWGNNVWSYYNQIKSDALLDLDIVSFDRIYNVQEDSSFLQRVLWGVRDYYHSVKETKQRLKGKCSYDVLHLCTSAQLGLIKDYVVIKEARKHCVKVALHLHFGRVPELIQKQNWEWRLLKRVIELADAVVTMDMKTYNALRSLGYSYIHYLPNPLSQTIRQQIIDEASSVVRSERKLCFVGHVIPTKGVYEMVEACKQIDDINLHVIGKVTPEIRSHMEGIAGKGEWLVFEGEKSHQDVIREMLSSSIFVLPSYTEGFPNVILESMACGCAIVATSVGAIPEMIGEEDGKQFGMIVNSKDVLGLKSAITLLLSNDTLKEECMSNAQQRVNQRYAMPIVWECLVNIWSSLIKDQRYKRMSV